MIPEIQNDLLLAVDLGGTKVAAALMTSSGRILTRNEEATCLLGPEQGISQIMRLLRELMDRAGVRSSQVMGIGVGIPAVLEPDTDLVVWAPNLSGWRNVALRPALEDGLGLPACIEYDGHTAVLGEWWLGAGRGYKSIAMVIIGTGLGGGLILDGKLYRGHDRLAGAAGWFTLTTDAELDDQPGLSLGHWESLVAGPGIARKTQALREIHPESQLNLLSPDEPLTGKQVFEAARQGDAVAGQILRETAGIIGLGVANIVSLINPEIVILGGSVGRQGDVLLPRIQQVVLRWAQPASARSVKFTTAKLGSDAGLYGAAYAVIERPRLHETR